MNFRKNKNRRRAFRPRPRVRGARGPERAEQASDGRSASELRARSLARFGRSTPSPRALARLQLVTLSVLPYIH